MVRWKRVACFAMILLLADLTLLRAQDPALQDEQVRERLAFITQILQDGQPGAKRWWYGWMAGYSAGAVAGGVLAATNWNAGPIDIVEGLPGHREFAQDMLVGGATFALGVVGLVMDPFTPATVVKKLRPLPETTVLERQAKLKKAEELLRDCARRERDGRSMKTHLLNAGVNAAAGIVTAAAFKRPWTDGLVTFATGEAVSLLNIFTQPMRATRDLKKYEAGYSMAAAPAAPRATWSLSVRPGGFAFRLQF